MTPGATFSTGLVSVVAIGPPSSMGWPRGIDHPADQGLPHRHLHDLARGPNLAALFDSS